MFLKKVHELYLGVCVVRLNLLYLLHLPLLSAWSYLFSRTEIVVGVILSNQDMIQVWAPNSTSKHRKGAWNILENLEYFRKISQ